jgi:predicted phage terminase large subunit-like protein
MDTAALCAQAPTLADIECAQIRRKGFAEFVRRAWHLVEPASPLRWNWHLDVLCRALERVARRETRDLAINIPPGMSKSLLVDVLFPAWVWTLPPDHAPGLPSMLFGPGHRFITASYAEDVVLRDARKMRTLVQSDWYRARWPGVEIPSDASASKAVSMFYTTRGGMRFSTTVRGSVTGQHCDTMVVDDPIDPMGAAAASGVELEAVLTWWNETMQTRFRDHATSARIVVMQRVHERDLSAEMIRTGAEVVCLPMRFESAHPHRCAEDMRTVEGELLCPDRFPGGVVARLEVALGPYGTASQLQQRPSPAGGGVFRKEWMQRYWTDLPAGGTFTQSWDMAFGATVGASDTCGQVWYQLGADFYLVDQDSQVRDFPSTLDAVRAMTARWPKAHKKLVEKKANGAGVIDMLKREIPGFEPIEPEGGKVVRANAVAAFFASGNVFFPHPERATYPDGRRGAPWMRGGVADLSRPAAEGSLEHVFTSFPNGSKKDPVDSATQFLNHAAPRLAQRFAAAMAAIRKG